jgi:anti-sigma factor ChrR (cupin superfamily)
LEVSEVDSRIVIVGGVTAANLPHVARNFRRSSSWSLSGVEIVIGVSMVMQPKTRQNNHQIQAQTGTIANRALVAWTKARDFRG